jgi:hypothetical protein
VDLAVVDVETVKSQHDQGAARVADARRPR